VLITSDERKRASNLDKHGLDFADPVGVLRHHAGRSTAVGRLKETIVVVVFSLMGSEAISVISMRLASKKERSYVA
jgi:uncharacterized protein